MSDHGNVISGAVTAKVVASKNEHKRPPLSPSLGAVKRHSASQSCFVSSFQNVQIGRATGCNFRSQMLSGIVRNLAWHNKLHGVLLIFERGAESSVSTYLKEIFCTTDENQLICQWCLQSQPGYRDDCSNSILQRLEISDATKSSSECTTLKYVPVGFQHDAMQYRGIMSACIAPTDMLPDCHVTPVLYAAALRGNPLVVDTVAVLDSLDSRLDQPQSSDNRRLFRVGNKWVWSCVWNHGSKNQFAIGTEKLAFIFDANTGKRFTLNTQCSDVLSQAFTSPVHVSLFVPLFH